MGFGKDGRLRQKINTTLVFGVDDKLYYEEELEVNRK